MGQEENKDNEIENKEAAEVDNGSNKGHVDPDVILDVPVLKVDEIGLNVENLEARVSLSAKLADLVNIEVGAYVHIDKVELNIKGVEAEAHLRVKLERVKNILNRTLETLDNNPDVLKALLQPVGEGLGKATGDIGEGAGGAVGSLGKGLGNTLQGVGDKVGGAVKSAGDAIGGGVVGKGLQKAGKTLVNWVTPDDSSDGNGKNDEASGKNKHRDSDGPDGKSGNKNEGSMDVEAGGETIKEGIHKEKKVGEEEERHFHKNDGDQKNKKEEKKEPKPEEDNGNEKESYPWLRKAVRSIMFVEELVKKPFEK